MNRRGYWAVMTAWLTTTLRAFIAEHPLTVYVFPALYTLAVVFLAMTGMRVL